MDANEWALKAHQIINGLDERWTGTAEQLRQLVVQKIGPPHHSTVWETMVMWLVRHRVLLMVGTYKQDNLLGAMLARSKVVAALPSQEDGATSTIKGGGKPSPIIEIPNE